MKSPSALTFLPYAAFVVLAALGGCGSKIGDSCSISSDCSPDGDRLCDGNSPDGYCTVPGCDTGTCPDDSICVQFFPVVNLDKTCDPQAAQTGCTIDEICTIGGKCAPRASEVRFCMATCSESCREGYECRTVERMKAHGGQPVPGEPAAQAFCAASRPCTKDSDCDFGDTCNTDNKVLRCE
jgi:hypothetical protein